MIPKVVLVMTGSALGSVLAQYGIDVPLKDVFVQVPGMAMMMIVVIVFVRFLRDLESRWASRIEDIAKVSDDRHEHLEGRASLCIERNTRALEENHALGLRIMAAIEHNHPRS